jgi:hypothetical protein
VEFNLSVICPECCEANKSGSTRCARCGAALKCEDATVDPELAEFSVAQAEAVERRGQKRLDRSLRSVRC